MADAAPRPSGELGRLTPDVRTLAKPQATPLVGARGVVARSSTLKGLFQQAKAEGWTPERLAGAITPELERTLDCEPEASIEVAQYLADEYFQIGDSVLVCDRVTGKAIARISDTDMYQPPDVRRESGNIVRPIPRLNPNLEGFLVSYIFEQERDREIRAELATRLPMVASMVPDLDPRLRSVTRVGRHAIAEDVRAALPDVLEGVQGSARAFLGLFDFVTEPPAGFDALPRKTAEARGRQNIADPKAMNLRFSWETAIKARTGASWVREMATHLVNEASTRIRPDLRLTVAHPLLTQEHITRPFWTGDPNTLRALHKAPQEAPTWRHISVFPCVPDQPGAVGLPATILRPIGAIIVHPDTYDFQSREVHGRWDMSARMEYTLFVNWEHIRFIRVTDIPVEAIAEIL